MAQQKIARDLSGILKLLKAQEPQIALVMAGKTPEERQKQAERFLRICVTALRTNAQLAECDPNSLLGAMMTAAQLNLEPNTPQGLAYLIPYKREATFQVGYKGLLQLAYRSGLVASINADVVYKAEIEAGMFRFYRGASPRIEHETDILRPDLRKGELVAAYAACTLRGGESLLRIVDAGDIEKAKKMSRSRNSDFSPWKTHPEAMWMKTALRRLAAWMPQTEDIGMALEQDRLGDAAVVDTRASEVDALNAAFAAPALAAADEGQTIDMTAQAPEPEALAAPQTEPAHVPYLDAEAAHEPAPKAAGTAREDGMRLCPRFGDYVSPAHCENGCQEREGCPEWQ